MPPALGQLKAVVLGRLGCLEPVARGPPAGRVAGINGMGCVDTVGGAPRVLLRVSGELWGLGCPVPHQGWTRFCLPEVSDRCVSTGGGQSLCAAPNRLMAVVLESRRFL